MSRYEIMPGTLGKDAYDVVHLLVPGRGRDDTGNGLDPRSFDRAVCAADFYTDHYLEVVQGVIVPSGYKSPKDENEGIPEAVSMQGILLSRGIPHDVIRPEVNSIDTVTNFTRAESGYFPNKKPVGIVAQEEHLERMIKIIAPRTLKRDYVGIVVPDRANRDHDSIIEKFVSRSILFGITPDTPNALFQTTRRANGIWNLANFLKIRA